MKIAITGAHSTGKSTLLEELRRLPELNNYKFKKENVREIADLGFKVNEESDLRTAKKFYELNCLLFDDNNIVTDRYILDSYVYASVIHTVEEFKELRNMYYSSIDKFYEPDIVFYIKPEFEIKDDGFRSTDKKFRDDVSKAFDLIIKDLSIPHYILSGSVEERAKQAQKIIKEKNEL